MNSGLDMVKEQIQWTWGWSWGALIEGSTEKQKDKIYKLQLRAFEDIDTQFAEALEKNRCNIRGTVT